MAARSPRRMAVLLYARGDSVLDYGERFFRQAVGIWRPSAPQALVEAVPVEDLEGADALLVSYNPIAEWEAKVEVKQTRRSSIEDALKVLTPAERRYYVLHKGFDKSYQEIAKECGVSFDTVKETLAKAYKRLRNELPPGRAYGQRRTTPRKKS